MRALKTFLRKRKADMLWCGDCECRTLKCWREANCICDDVSPVPPESTLIDSVSNFSETSIALDIHDEPLEITFEYSPAEWNSWIELQYDENPYFIAEITSLENWQWVITIIPIWDEDMAEDATIWVYLEATQDVEETITVDITWP